MSKKTLLNFSPETPPNFLKNLLEDPETDPTLCYYAYQAERARLGLPRMLQSHDEAEEAHKLGKLIKSWYLNNRNTPIPEMSGLKLSD